MLPATRKTSIFDNGLFDSFKSIGDDFYNALQFDFNSFFDSSWKSDKDGNDVFEIEVPGFNKDNLTVTLENHVLVIKGETKTKKILKRYTIGNVNEVNANIKDGILSLTFIKKEEDKIKINIE